ncbi:MAG: hypothetical protein ACO29V_08685 [Limnohabitans sp.]
MAGLITGASIISGELIVSLDSGEIIRVGYVQGPTGLQGPQGPMGATGRPGQDGNTILHGAGTPRPDEGKDGDFWIDTVEWTIRLKASGRWGAPQPLIAPAKNRSGEFGADRRMNGGPGRFFPMGGVSSAVAAPPPTGDGLEPIIGNGQPLGANIWSPLAIDADGDLMEMTVYFRRAGGNEVYVAKVIVCRANLVGNITIAWENVTPDTLPYTVEFDAPVVGTELTLRVRSSIGWDEVRGRVSKL